MFLLIDKPKGITSHDVVDEIRKITGIKKVGHAGTLDPNATGLLVVGITRAGTKQLGSISKNTSKTYAAEVFLGEVRDTDDSEGEVVEKKEVNNIPSDQDVEFIIEGFLGKQMQIPPAYSAIKVKGKKAYEQARKGKEVDLPKREIEVYSIELIGYKYPILKFDVIVSSGTYIRSLARDIGEKLGTGGYLKELRRTKVGDFSLDNAVELSLLTEDNWKEYTI